MTTDLDRLEADVHERAMDPDLPAADVLRAILASEAAPPGATEGEAARERAMRRGAMRAWLERTGTSGDDVTGDAAAPPES